METKRKYQRRTGSSMPEGFKIDPTLNERYPDALFSGKHAQAAENFKKTTLVEDMPKMVPSPSMQKKFDEAEALLRKTGLLPLK